VAHGGAEWWWNVREFGATELEETTVERRIEERRAQTECGDGVPVGAGDAFDQAVKPESAQVVSHGGS